MIRENSDPLALFRDWYAEAAKSEPNDPDAVALATVGIDAGTPDPEGDRAFDPDEAPCGPPPALSDTAPVQWLAREDLA
jgi:hypothetical protein